MSARTSLALYKQIKAKQTEVEYAASIGYYFGTVFAARSIASAYGTLVLRAETLHERSAVVQLKKLHQEI